MPRQARWVALLLSVMASACQSSNTASDVLGSAVATPAAAQGESARPVQASLVLGKGPTKVSMLLPLSAAGSVAERGKKMMDGAQLAMNDLGNSLITLSIDDTHGDEARAKELAVKAMSSGARIVIGPVEPTAAQSIATLSGPKRAPVLALADDFAGAPGVYSMCLTEVDSAAAAAAALAEQGKRKFVLLVARGSDAAAAEKRVANTLSIYGAKLPVSVPFDPAESGEKAVADMMALVEAPEVIIVVNGGTNPASLLAALKAKGFTGKNTAIVGTSRWLERSLAEPLLQGAYVAALDTTETGPIAGRFKSGFGYEPDLDVAYAYDAIALSAGIASALGPEGFSKKVLENRGGFRGTTGLFRFRPDGASERSMAFYRIENGALKKIAKSTSSF